jgi:hypothetical protein
VLGAGVAYGLSRLLSHRPHRRLRHRLRTVCAAI